MDLVVYKTWEINNKHKYSLIAKHLRKTFYGLPNLQLVHSFQEEEAEVVEVREDK